MAARKGVARLASLYGMMERMRSVELRVAAVAVADVVCSAAVAATLRESQIADARAAMATGCREEWQVAETTRGVIETRMVRLAALRVECQDALDEAVAVHRVSRMNMEQMNRVLERSRAELMGDESRRAQAESDDRFAARLAWERSKNRVGGA
jgi:hypothetical protein